MEIVMFTSSNMELSETEKAAVAAMVQHVRANVDGSASSGYAAKGKALADMVIAEARHQGTIWHRFYKDLIGLEAEGRKAFRSEINKHTRAMTEHVKANSDDPKNTNPVWAGARRSAITRLSELTTISNALDTGVEMEESWPFHFAVAHAREVLRSQGVGSKKGRPAKPWLDKLKDFISKNVPPEEMDKAEELIQTMKVLQESKE
jgi:hypothetical protein